MANNSLQKYINDIKGREIKFTTAAALELYKKNIDPNYSQKISTNMSLDRTVLENLKNILYRDYFTDRCKKLLKSLNMTEAEGKVVDDFLLTLDPPRKKIPSDTDLYFKTYLDNYLVDRKAFYNDIKLIIDELCDTTTELHKKNIDKIKAFVKEYRIDQL